MENRRGVGTGETKDDIVYRLSQAEFQNPGFVSERKSLQLAQEQAVKKEIIYKSSNIPTIFRFGLASVVLGGVLYLVPDDRKPDTHDGAVGGESSETSKEVAKGYPEAVIEDEGNGHRGLSLTVKGERMSGIGHVPDRANYVRVADVIETREGNTMVTIIFNTGETTVFIFEKDSGRVSRTEPWFPYKK